MTEPTRDDRTTFTRVTEGIYWFLVVDVLIVLASSPTIVVWLLLAREASNIPLYLASLLLALPAISAALYAWRKRAEDPDPIPVRIFLRGYRQNALDSLKVGVPAALVLMVLSINIAYGDSAGTGALILAFAILAAIVVLIAARGLSIVSTFRFRLVDALRLSVFTLLTMPLRTLSLISLGVLVAGISLFVGDYAFLFLASLLTFAVWTSEKPVLARLRAEFVASESASTDGDSAADDDTAAGGDARQDGAPAG
ncbi:DUF624 domain-containing protein [Brachybacterium sp. GCM10030267]|uniref:DUF624 domain-containing protein n=1 Tax=Brachybacterium sp. GCM10030267 TaxID=3273381 RepID=UPI00360B01C9